MPLMHGMLNLVMLAITIWCYWRILTKAGHSGWWAYLLILSLGIVFIATIFHSPVFLFAPYIMPAIMIWIFAFIRWPSFEGELRGPGDNRYTPQGRDRLEAMPSADPHRKVNPKFGDADGARRKRRRKEHEK